MCQAGARMGLDKVRPDRGDAEAGQSRKVPWTLLLENPWEREDRWGTGEGDAGTAAARATGCGAEQRQLGKPVPPGSHRAPISA